LEDKKHFKAMIAKNTIHKHRKVEPLDSLLNVF